MDHPRELGHVHLKVRDVERAVEFYTEILGLDVTERTGQFAFLTFGERHHDVALQGLGPDAPSRGDEPLDSSEARRASHGPNRGVGLYHAAFEVEDPEALAATHRRLRERGISVSPVDHGISKALYFSDPDGNGLEVYLDTRNQNDQRTWGGQNARFDPEALAE